MARSPARSAKPLKAVRNPHKAVRKPAAVKKPSAAPGTVPLQRVAKGTRPQFYDDPAVDHLFAIVTALAAELSVAFDRIDTLERVLAAADRVAPEAIEGYRPDAAAAAIRGRKRAELLQRVFAVFEASEATPVTPHP